MSTESKLPIGGTLVRLMAGVWWNRHRLAAALWLPLVLIAMLDLYLWNMTSPAGIDEAVQMWLHSVMIVAASCVLWATMAVSCHRVILQDSNRPTPFEGIGLRVRQLRYIVLGIAVSIPVVVGWVLVMTLYSALGDRGIDDEVGVVAYTVQSWVAFALAQYPGARLALVLPAAALDRPLTLRSSFQITKGNGWRLTAVMLAVPFAISLFGYLIDAAVRSDTYWNQAIWVLVGFFSAAYYVGALSYAYEWFESNVRNDADSSAAQDNEQ